MNTMFLRLYVKLENLVGHEEGQDLVEYALVVAIIALGVVASLRTVASSIGTEFSVIEAAFASAI
jgi:pilus assembly protein Flp/PilA